MKKKVIITSIAIIIIAVAIPTIIMIQETSRTQRQEELERAYITQNTFFGTLVDSRSREIEERNRYIPLYPRDLNIDGINTIITAT